MKLIAQILKSFFVFGLLTILTQVGGIVYLIYKFIHILWGSSKPKWSHKFLFFSCLYFFTSIFIVPNIAPYFGRQKLNWFSTDTQSITPHTYLTCLLNRHYVTPQLHAEVEAISKVIHQKYPEVQLQYFDANFPFWDGFPLLPHLSHDDGQKLDIAFIYKSANGQILKKGPGLIGYGHCVEPNSDEVNQPLKCTQKGYWQYNFLKKITLPTNRKKYIFDEQINKDLLRSIHNRKRIKKIFLEPHLKTRLGLKDSSKIRFHVCQSVRHDDHIHLQL